VISLRKINLEVFQNYGIQWVEEHLIVVVSKHAEPSQQELHALAILWSEGPSTVSFVHESMHGNNDRTYTTTLAVMRNLERKNLASRSKDGRAHVYEAKVDRETILKPRLKDLVQNAFGGSLGQAILSMISVGVMTPEEKRDTLREIKLHKAMAAKKKTTKKKAAKKAVKKTVKRAAKKKVAKKAARKPAKKAAKKKAENVQFDNWRLAVSIDNDFYHLDQIIDVELDGIDATRRAVNFKLA